MKLKAIVDSLDDVPEQFHELYTERNGKFEFTGVEGMKTDADIERLQKGLTKERNEHRETKQKLASFSALGDPEEVHARLDRFEELETAAGGKLDDEQINKLVEGRIKTRLAPVERELNQFKARAGELEATVGTYQARERSRAIGDAVGKAARAAKVQDSALEDVMLFGNHLFEVDEEGRVVTKDGVGVTPGLEPQQWLDDIQSKKPHWFQPVTTGGGAGGGAGRQGMGGTNPFTAEAWNMSEQGKILRENPTRAEQLAKAAGTTVGGPKPAPKK